MILNWNLNVILIGFFNFLFILDDVKLLNTSYNVLHKVVLKIEAYLQEVDASD